MNSTDNEGIEKLLRREFVLYEDRIFFKPAPYDENRIRNMIERVGIEDVQRMINHEHLHMYVTDQTEQKRVAKLLQQVWQERLANQFANHPFSVEVLDEAGEAVITVRDGKEG